MIGNRKKFGRRRFILWSGLASLSLILFSLIKSRFVKPSDKVKQVKFLDRDGNLVAIDASHLKYSEKVKRASNTDLQSWIDK